MSCTAFNDALVLNRVGHEAMSDLLPRIPGNYIAKALQTLPPAERAAAGGIMECFVNVPDLGRVRITARRMKHKRGRSTHYFWSAESVVKARESQ
jgi:hypothetical protein